MDKHRTNHHHLANRRSAILARSSSTEALVVPRLSIRARLLVSTTSTLVNNVVAVNSVLFVALCYWSDVAGQA